MNVIYNVIEGIVVETIQMDTISLMHQTAYEARLVKCLVECGGFAARNIPKESAQALKLQLNENGVHADTYDFIVTVHEEFISCLTPEELKAVLYHEIAHVKFDYMSGDMDSVIAKTKKGKHVTHNVEACEMRADAYAVAAVSASAMLSVIDKLQTMQIMKLTKLRNVKAIAFVKAITTSSIIRMRKKVLKKMISN